MAKGSAWEPRHLPKIKKPGKKYCEDCGYYVIEWCSLHVPDNSFANTYRQLDPEVDNRDGKCQYYSKKKSFGDKFWAMWNKLIVGRIY